MPDNPARPSLVAEVDPAELAVRMCEASYGQTRPPGATALEALLAMEEDSRDGWMRAAHVAMEYLRDCLNNAKRPS
jgi:hypothetical protein